MAKKKVTPKKAVVKKKPVPMYKDGGKTTITKDEFVSGSKSSTQKIDSKYKNKDFSSESTYIHRMGKNPTFQDASVSTYKGKDVGGTINDKIVTTEVAKKKMAEFEKTIQKQKAAQAKAAEIAKKTKAVTSAKKYKNGGTTKAKKKK